MDYCQLFDVITSDPRYLANLDWGTPRSGHPEGTVRAHIAELEANLDRLKAKLSDEDYWKLKILIHVHDSFKADANAGVAITHPDSHASLARAFLAEHCDDGDLLAMVQFHDESFALYRQVEYKGSYNRKRFAKLLETIGDWNLFLAFHIIDGCTAGKPRAPLEWLFAEIDGKVESVFTAADIIR